MEDIIIVWSEKSQAAELWVNYLKTCFEHIRKNKNKPPFKILSIAIEDMEESGPMSPTLESKLRHARLEIVIICPAFLDHVLQYPERTCKLAAHLQPANVLAMLLGVEKASLTEQHRAALLSFSQWKTMESVKDRDEKFVSEFLGGAMEILSKSPPVGTPQKSNFMLIPKKINHSQKKVVISLEEPLEKEDVVEVSIIRNGDEVQLSGVVRKNAFTLIIRVPDVYLGVTSLVTIKVTKNGTDLGTKQLKCESQLHTLEYILKHCDQPLDFSCQALNVVPSDKAKLDDFFVKAFQRNVPPNFNLIQSAGLGQVTRGTISQEELPTLLHFAAKFGFEQLAWALVECPGGDIACELRNNKEMTPAEMADSAGHKRLSNILSGYMQMAQFSNEYAFLKGIVDNKTERSGTSDKADDEYLIPRPAMDTYQVPPTPRPCEAPPLGYMPMTSPGSLCKVSTKSLDFLSEPTYVKGNYTREKLLQRSLSEEQHVEEVKSKSSNSHCSNGAEEELIEIINDFKNNVFTISEVEDLVNQWRRRNDVQQSFKEKQEHLTKLREEYDRVQQRMKEEMREVGRPSPMERIRNFFRGKSKEGKNTKSLKRKNKSEKKKAKEEGSRPNSSLSILSTSSSSSSSRASTGSRDSSVLTSDHESVPTSSKPCRPTELNLNNHFLYDMPPTPISIAKARNYDIPPSPIELAAACNEYCNMPPIPKELIYGKLKSGLRTVIEESDNKTVNGSNQNNSPSHGEAFNGSYGNLPLASNNYSSSHCETLKIVETDCNNLPEYVNVDTPVSPITCT